MPSATSKAAMKDALGNLTLTTLEENMDEISHTTRLNELVVSRVVVAVISMLPYSSYMTETDFDHISCVSSRASAGSLFAKKDLRSH
jgi:hypothetical protein